MEEVAVGWSDAEEGSRETAKSHALGKDEWGCQKTRPADKDLVGWCERRSQGAWTGSALEEVVPE